MSAVGLRRAGQVAECKSPFSEGFSSDAQSDERAQKISMLGLRAIPVPAKPTPKMTFEELEKELSQYDVTAQAKHIQVTQKEIVDLIRKLHGALLYIPYDHFRHDTDFLTHGLIGYLKGERYAIGVIGNKSNTWVAEHAIQAMKTNDLPARTVDLEDRESTEALSSSWKEAIDAGIKKFVIFDDIIYSGSQMEAHIFRWLKALKQYKEIDGLELIVVSVYTSEDFKTRIEKIKKLKGKVTLITSETRLPTVNKVLDLTEVRLLQKVYPRLALAGAHCLLYSDWKVADVKSVPQFLHCGLKLKEGVFRFVRSPEPFYPPYKDRKVLKDIYSIDDPFENTSPNFFE